MPQETKINENLDTLLVRTVAMKEIVRVLVKREAVDSGDAGVWLKAFSSEIKELRESVLAGSDPTDEQRDFAAKLDAEIERFFSDFADYKK